MLILAKLYNYGQLSYNNNIFLKIFDTNIMPVLVYGAEFNRLLKSTLLRVKAIYMCKT